MNNFARVVRLALHYRLTVATAFLSALVVAGLWGGNIGAVYPFMKVAFEGKSLQQWVGDEIVKARQTAAQQAARLETLQKESAAAPPEHQATIESEISHGPVAADGRAMGRGGPTPG